MLDNFENNNKYKNIYGDSNFAVPVETKNEPFYQEMRSIDQAFDKYTLQQRLSKKRIGQHQSGLLLTISVLFLMVAGIVVGSFTGIIQGGDQTEAHASSFNEDLLPSAADEGVKVESGFPSFYSSGGYDFIKNSDGSVTVKPSKSN